MKYAPIALAALAVLATPVHAAPLMSAEWTAQACDAWNKDALLAGGLADKWIKDGKAMCVYGGAVQNASMDYSADYTMHATTERWNEMGAGEYGPMKAMMFGRLKFTGPKMEAMSVMGPFEAFLRLPGKIAGDQDCPAK